MVGLTNLTPTHGHQRTNAMDGLYGWLEQAHKAQPSYPLLPRPLHALQAIKHQRMPAASLARYHHAVWGPHSI